MNKQVQAFDDVSAVQPSNAPRQSVTIRLPAGAIARLRADAASRGWTISDVVEAALLGKAPRYAVRAAAIAQPLVAIGYCLTQALQALRSGDDGAACSELEEARGVVVSVLQGLHDDYDAELDTQDAERRDRWDG